MAETSTKLFVGQVPQTTTEQELRDVFALYGTVNDVEFMRDKVTNAPKGCAFVVFADDQEATLACENLNEKVTLPGARRTLIVNKHISKDGGECKLYVSMLSYSTTEAEVKQMFEPYGTINEVFIISDKATGQSKGHGFVKFASKSDAKRAIQALNDTIKDKDAPNNIRVRFAHNAEEKSNASLYNNNNNMNNNLNNNLFSALNGMGMGALAGGDLSQLSQVFGNAAGYGVNGMNGMSPYGMNGMNGMNSMNGMNGMSGVNGSVPVFGGAGPVDSGKTFQAKGPAGANLFVLGLPFNYGDVDLGNLFANFGNLLSSKIQVDVSTGQSKGFGFVSFDNAYSATAAIQAIDGSMVGGRRLKVQVKKNDGGPGRPY